MASTTLNYSNVISFDPISRAVAKTFINVVLVFVCGSVSLFGLAGNVLNIIVFVRQGFKETINISLLGLAVADLMCVIIPLWMSVSCSPYFASLGLPFNGIEIMYMTGPCIRVCSNRITSFINAFLAIERCLCIAMPLKVKILITPRKTKVIIISIFIGMVILFSPFYFVHKLEWRYNSRVNRTLLSLVFTKDRDLVNSVTFLIHSVILSVVCLFSVIFCTIVLIVKLNEKAQWRQKSTSQGSSLKNNPPSRKEQKVVKMVTLISAIFIICYLPATVNFLVMSSFPDFSIAGKYMNSYYVVWILTILLETINSSVNILVYLQMSSKFRNTLIDLCACVKK